MAGIEAPSKKIFETDKYRKMDIVDINNNIAVFGIGQGEYSVGIKLLKINLDLAKE
jgi:tetratricopeptide (TPR) repeat protein